MLSMKAMDFHVLAWKVCGVWHRPGQPRWYIWYAVLTNLMCYILFPFFIAAQLFFTDTVRELMDILLFLPTSLVGLKSALIVLNQPKLLRLFGLLHEMDRMVQTDEQREQIRKALRVSRRLIVFLSTEFYVSIAAHFALPLMSEGPVLMWSAWYPLDYKNVAAIYYALMVYQLLATVMCAYLLSSLDVYGLALYRVLSAHLDILGSQLRQLGRNGNERPVDCERALRKCIVYHNLCINYSHCLNDIVSIQYFLQFGMSGIIICGSEFKLISINPFDDIPHYTLVVLYVVGMIFEILMPCYYGSQVKAKSEQLIPDMFSANWMDQSMRFKKIMLIFNERANRPITPFAGGLFALALSNFVATMRFAYSLLALLKNMETKE